MYLVCTGTYTKSKKYFAIISLKFYSLLRVDTPVTICPAQFQARPALCFISLIKISELGRIA
jgi:hypothetical protein